MHLPANRQPRRLPKRFPVGTTYVVEGYGGEEGDLRVISRYVILPGGRRFNVPADLPRSASARALARLPNLRQSQGKSGPVDGPEKFVARGGTVRQQQR